jgi:hypothetical protein
MANHPKPSSKNAEGETRKKPFTMGDFDRMLERGCYDARSKTRSKIEVKIKLP